MLLGSILGKVYLKKQKTNYFDLRGVISPSPLNKRVGIIDTSSSEHSEMPIWEEGLRILVNRYHPYIDVVLFKFI